MKMGKQFYCFLGRSQVVISTFGFRAGGFLSVNVTDLRLRNATDGAKLTKANVAFILEKTKSSANSLLMDTQSSCAIRTLKANDGKAYQVIFTKMYRGDFN